eukprot:CAMPEP_0178442226 /NCGR_PEP_ID=MMETSP0689_2-20121128/38024_1 /TAXON_ID=160604 /ORGANISM="Amphidinium massartii, Strain CS-259" /LENGTH=196 /DNA_ID=CAMNT_0020065703 /DNA_START=245 /DNA_END=835 /DNA_ORIENTATION=+
MPMDSPLVRSKHSSDDTSIASRSTSTSASGTASWTLKSNSERSSVNDGLDSSASLSGRPLRLPGVRATSFEMKAWPAKQQLAADRFNITTSMPPMRFQSLAQEHDAEFGETSNSESILSRCTSDVSLHRRRLAHDVTLADSPPSHTMVAPVRRSRTPARQMPPSTGWRYQVKDFHNGNAIILSHREDRHKNILWRD